MIQISPQEWKLIGLISLFFIILALYFLLIGTLATPKDSIYVGTQYLNALDTPVYYSWIEQAKAGNFLFKDLFTHEPHPRYILDIFWLSLGWLAKILSLSSITIYHLARLFLIPLLLIILYIFISYFFEERLKRKLCFLFLVFASGLGGVTVAGKMLGFWNLEPWSLNRPMDSWVPEGFTFLTLYHSPHLMASLIFILSIFLLIILAFDKNKIIYSLGAGLCALILFQFHPFHVPTIFTVTGVYIIILSIKDKKIRWDLLRHYLILFLFSLPSILYHLWALKTFWTRQQYALQNNCLTPAIKITLLSYGFLVILAFIGTLYLIRKKKQKQQRDLSSCMGHRSVFTYLSPRQFSKTLDRWTPRCYCHS